MWEAYVGHYRLDETAVDVVEIGDRLAAVFPGTPPGFEVILQPQADEHTFTMLGGPASGAPAVFQLDEKGVATAVIVGGEYEMMRSEPLPPSDIPTGQGLLAPPLELDKAKEAAFAALMAQMLDSRDGRVLDYQLPYPKHEFIRYLAQQEQFIFHGSGKHDIDEFRTRRTSMELKDKSGRGNVQGIYGTHDGLWPLFFAIVNRDKISGSIRNGFSELSNADGETIRIYHFSINQEWLDKDPWRQGMLYILPRETFRRMPATVEGGVSNEWVSEVSLKPLARLLIEPMDFPFLAQVGGHDDSALLRLGELQKLLFAHVEVSRPLPEGFALLLQWNDELADSIVELMAGLRQFVPTGRYALRFEPDGTYFDIEGPPAFQQVIQDRLANQ